MRVIALVFIVAITGCATTEQQADFDIAEFAPYCEKLGYEKNTDKWRDCIQNQAISYRQNRNAPMHCVPSRSRAYCY